jgi:NAD(P)-dependent dehydrogenase (short-subunit alcohol dehydrogenase family)
MSGPAVFITGAARGIGAAVAHQLARKGARLALAGLEPTRLEQLAAGLGGPHAWFGYDVTDQSALDRAVDGAVRTFGGIDVAIANAGIASIGPVLTASADELARVIDVNLTGLVRTVRSTLPHVIARRGYYLLVSSVAAFVPMPGLTVYSATKSGVEQFGRTLGYELAGKGVSVGIAYPCWIDTDLVRGALADRSMLREALNRLPGPFWHHHFSRCLRARDRQGRRASAARCVRAAKPRTFCRAPAAAGAASVRQVYPARSRPHHAGIRASRDGTGPLVERTVDPRWQPVASGSA